MIKLSKKRKFLFNNISKKKKNNLLEALVFVKKYSLCNFIESLDISIRLSKEFLKFKNKKFSFYLPYSNIKFSKTFFYFPKKYFLKNKSNSFLKNNVGFINFDIFKNIKNFNYDFIVTNKYYLNYFLFFKKKKIFKKIILKKNLFVTDDIDLYLNKEYLTNFKLDKNCVINCSLGKLNFNIKYLFFNILEFVKYINSLKPLEYKGKFILSVYISSTMGVSYNIFLNSIYNYF